MGNIDSKRDWGFAKDYVDCMWRMLQKDEPKDYVIATGINYSIRDFADKAFRYAGLDFNKYLKISKKFYRPTDVETLLGDPSKAVRDLDWNPNSTSIDNLIKIMVDSDLKLVDAQKNGFDLYSESSINLFDHFSE